VIKVENQKLATWRIPKLLWSLAFPAICAQIVTLLYNLVDRIYIGQMQDGAIAMAAIGICAPIVTVVTAFTGLFGRGGSPHAAIHMGRQDNRTAEKFLGNSLSMLLITSVLITVGVLALKSPILRIFGASDQTLPYADSYLTIYIVGTIFVQITVGMNYYITSQGFAKTAMITTMLGAVLNMALDPLFIFAMHMGVAGAALATVISQMASFVWVLLFLMGKKPTLRVRRENLRPDWKTLKQIIILGSAPFFMSASEGVLHVCFNRQVYTFGGDLAVGAMTILFSMFQFVLLPVEGVAQGSQPIIGYNYGSGAYHRVRAIIRLALTANSIFTVIVTAVVVLFPELFIRIFNSDPQLVDLGGRMLQIYIFGVFTTGANSTFQQTYNSLGEGGKSFFFAFYRKVILLIPLIYILPNVLRWGVFAVVLAEPISDILTAVTNAVYFRRFLKKKLPVEEGSYA
jgi:putative MATE family efflux protein